MTDYIPEEGVVVIPLPPTTALTIFVTHVVCLLHTAFLPFIFYVLQIIL